jgi:hypothetical protein
MHVCMHEQVLCWSEWLTKADTVEIVSGYLRAQGCKRGRVDVASPHL